MFPTGCPITTICELAFPVGFRRIEIKDSVLKINNRRILVKGVNRHEMSATGGYTVTLDEMKRDIAALKSINANAVRTCHYPNDPDWYTLCDQNGIYVWAEANIESVRTVASAACINAFADSEFG